LNKFALLAFAGFIAAATPLAAQGAKPVFGTWGYDSTAMDRSVKPGDDFFAFVNGEWAKRTQIAPDRTFVGIDSVLNDQIEKDVRALVEGAAASSTGDRTAQQVGDYYASWMDQAAIDAKGLAPAKPWLDEIAAANSRGALIDLFARPEFGSPVGLGIEPDEKEPTRYAAKLYQGGLGLPSRDYYLLPGAKYQATRKAYRDYLIKLQTLAGMPDSEARADRIVALETAMARVHWTPERSRDAEATYNPMSRAKLRAFAPQLQPDRWLAKAGLAAAPSVTVAQLSAVQAEARLFAATPVGTWKDWLQVRFLSDHARYLPSAFDQANFDFFSKTLRDVPVQRDRWKRGMSEVNDALGEAVGALYVQRHYPAESDRQVGELITNIRGALQDRIEQNGWMDAPTKREALAKLASFDPRTGHPATYIDYSSLEVKRGDLLGNAIRASRFEEALQLKRFPKPVDRSLWYMTPQTNNAYYDPSQNQITFPAAILQPPYFDPKADPASNYGSIGATIGHEIGHGFDDQGRKYDAKGRLRDWWTPKTAAEYTKRTVMLSKQFSGYEPIPGVRIKGDLTLGENLGDLGGLEVAYAAYRRFVAKHGEPALIDGLTGDQRFFIAYGYSWESKTREGALRERLLSDPHSPPAYRVNGIVRNFDPWYAAFAVKPGDKLYLPPEQRVRIWF
jgi:endothelin-converting enzyme/putative endopeptidase